MCGFRLPCGWGPGAEPSGLDLTMSPEEALPAAGGFSAGLSTCSGRGKAAEAWGPSSHPLALPHSRPSARVQGPHGAVGGVTHSRGSCWPTATAERRRQLSREARCVGCWRWLPGQRPADWRPWGPQMTAGVHCVMATHSCDQRRGGPGDPALETLKEVLTAPACLGPGACHVQTGTIPDKRGHPIILPLRSLEARQTHRGL